MDDSSSTSDEEDSKGDSATMVTPPPLFPQPTREEAEHLYQGMISAMKNHNQSFSDLIRDSPHSLALCSLLVGCSPDLPTSWEELMATPVRFDFPYSSFLLDTVNKTTTMVPYTPEGFKGTDDKPKIPNFLHKALLVILSSYLEMDQSRFVVQSDKSKLRETTIATLFVGRCTGPVTIALLPNWFS
jgi:hypothetical protein